MATGDETRQSLIDAAEQLFAEQGVDAVSIRSINVAAGLAPASVHYHFRSKDGLLTAVIARRGRLLRERQEAFEAQLQARIPRWSADEIVLSIALPVSEVVSADPAGGARWLRIVAGLLAAGDERVEQVGFGPGSFEERLDQRVVAAFPAVAADEARAAWRMASTVLFQLLARLADGERALDRGRFGDVVTFVTAGLVALTTP